MIAVDFVGALRKLLRRFKHDKLASVVAEWGVIEKHTAKEVFQNQTLKTKKAVVEGLLDACKEKQLTKKNVAELDLIYNYHHSESKKWSVFELHGKSGQHDALQTKEFGAKLREQLNFYFKHDLCVKKVDSALWIRIGIHEGASSQLWLPSNVIYMVHHPQSHYIIFSRIKVSHKDYLMQAVLNTLQCTEIKELQLTGQSVTSLADLALNRQSQGGFAQYRLNQVHGNPLSRRSQRKRKASSEIDLVDVAVTNENIKEREKQEKQTEDVFGRHRQPKLQKLEYRLETRFRGTNHAPAMALHQQSGTPFKCYVKYEGPSVLEGIKGLCNKGLASYPLPYHISNTHSLGKNHFVLADKKKPLPKGK
ncbi:centromere protein N-like [Amphiura filiformis]|uniref:centromere protein N-like n=1 Tax=Amphiura filiformis TaxID=82378 RepID=UPI003B225EAF